MAVPETLTATGELLQAARQYGLGVVFEPAENGRRVSYVLQDWAGLRGVQAPGRRAVERAYDLYTAAAAALKL